MADHDDAMALVLESLTSGPTKAIDSLEEIDAVGHRIVQGGKYFDRSVLIDDDVIQKIDELAELAPLHNKAALMGINACLKHMPSTPMVAVFDTSFFQTLPPKAYMYPLPYELYEKYAIRKYGAHGTSHRYISERAPPCWTSRSRTSSSSRATWATVARYRPSTMVWRWTPPWASRRSTAL